MIDPVDPDDRGHGLEICLDLYRHLLVHDRCHHHHHHYVY
jgi:hypothetical protein